MNKANKCKEDTELIDRNTIKEKYITTLFFLVILLCVFAVLDVCFVYGIIRVSNPIMATISVMTEVIKSIVFLSMIIFIRKHLT